jgi:2-oxoglutarate ferredoxin oxidoreductase subunit gamma
MIKILIAGEGGQGVQAIAEILAKAAFLENKKALYIPNFGVEQRGGVSLAFVVIDDKEVVYPKFEKADILAVLSERSRERVQVYLEDKTKLILGPAVTKKAVDLPNKAWNILVLGQINKEGAIVNKQNLIKAMEERFANQFAKNPQLREIDIKALE